jgi:hypothetical protein
MEIGLTRRPGHRIKMPPEDYDSWCLGHIIFEPHADTEMEEQCRAILDRITIEVD